jgi:hypothetical protein
MAAEGTQFTSSIHADLPEGHGKQAINRFDDPERIYGACHFGVIVSFVQIDTVREKKFNRVKHLRISLVLVLCASNPWCRRMNKLRL